MQLEHYALCPRGAPGLEHLQIDLSVIHSIKERTNEISFVNKEKAPELLTYFMNCYQYLSGLIHKLTLEAIVARSEREKIWCDALLERAPYVVKSKGGGINKGTQIQLEAAAHADPEYRQAKDNEDSIRGWIAFLDDSRKAVEYGYHSVKKIMSDYSPNGIGNIDYVNPKLNENSTAGDTVSGRWGNPKF